MKTKRTSFLILLCFVSQFIWAQVKDSIPYITVSGEVTKTLKLDATDLLKMEHKTVSAKNKSGKEISYSGVPVETILKLAGVTINKELHGENLAKYLLVKSADGYQVLFSLAELDSAFTDKVVILADESEGKPLAPGKGPFQLVVPGEKRPARSSSQVTEFVIRFAKE